MIKIVLNCQNPSDAVSYYRSIGVLRHIKEVHFDLLRSASWHDMAKYDVLYLQRPSTKEELNAAKIAKDIGVKVWIDYDDNIIDVPPTNPAYSKYVFCNEIVRDLLNIADLVTVSTEELRNAFGTGNVVLNALMPEVERLSKDIPKRSGKVSWRGSNTHEEDVLSEIEWIQGAHANGADFHFFGCLPACCANFKAGLTPFLDVLNFYKAFRFVAPTIHIVPLKRNKFNLSKSNISWIEATAIGASVIASKGLHEFEKPGIAFFDGSGALSRDLSLQYIMDNLRLETYNQLRLELIRECIERK